jgi:uncharacterized protein (TIGR03083 family)
MADDTGSAPGIVADSSAAGLISQLEQVWAALEDLGHDVTDEEWRTQTPCPGWDVAAQYAHMIGTESMLLGRAGPEIDPGRPEHIRNDIGGVNEKWVAWFATQSRDTVLGEFAQVTRERLAALAKMTEEDFSAPSWTPVGQADYRRFMQIRVFDCWVHDQDIRDAVQRPGDRSGPVAEQSIDEVVRAIGYIVGKRAGAPAGSSVLIRLTGPVERDVAVAVVDGKARAVASLDVAPTATVELSSDAFARLACGRIDPQTVLDGAFGGVTMSGEAELAYRVATSLAFTI